MKNFRFEISTLVATFLLASAAHAEITDEQLIWMFGEADIYRKVFAETQTTILNDDREGFAALVHYPFAVYQPKEECCGSEVLEIIEDADEFLEKFDEIVTPEVRKVIVDQEFDELLLNWRGLGFDVGAVWIVGHCIGDNEDDPCSETVVGIKSISAHSAKVAIQ